MKFDTVGTAALVACAALAALVGASGCTPDYGEARFEVDGVADANECLAGAFPFEPSFFAARERLDAVGVFLQSSSVPVSRTDFVMFEVYRPDVVRERLGQPIALAGRDVRDPIVRGLVGTYESCPDNLDSYLVTGKVVFEALDVDYDRRVEGRLVGAAIIDARTGESVAERLEGSWRFDVRRGPPFEEFFAPREPRDTPFPPRADSLER